MGLLMPYAAISLINLCLDHQSAACLYSDIRLRQLGISLLIPSTSLFLKTESMTVQSLGPSSDSVAAKPSRPSWRDLSRQEQRRVQQPPEMRLSLSGSVPELVWVCTRALAVLSSTTLSRFPSGCFLGRLLIDWSSPQVLPFLAALMVQIHLLKLCLTDMVLQSLPVTRAAHLRSLRLGQPSRHASSLPTLPYSLCSEYCVIKGMSLLNNFYQ